MSAARTPVRSASARFAASLGKVALGPRPEAAAKLTRVAAWMASR
jgi:hypothetical protein